MKTEIMDIYMYTYIRFSSIIAEQTISLCRENNIVYNNNTVPIFNSSFYIIYEK